MLPRDVAADPDRLARFEREARLLAALNHPNIATIHGLQDADGAPAIVMELVEGETLADRLVARPSMEEAVAIARQWPTALDAAHERGIVHRDLKPANIKVTPERRGQGARFRPCQSAAHAPTVSAAHRARSPSRLADSGRDVLGTAAYMSPEQARGQQVDKRTDIWAFGCVLFEMVAGQRPFEGETFTEISANVLKDEPPWRLLPAGTPASIVRLLRRCLAKDAAQRLHDIADARLEIDDAQQSEGEPAQSAPTRSRTALVAWAVAAACVVLAAVALPLRSARPAAAPEEVRFDISTPEGSDPLLLGSHALSPDGRQLLFVADSDGQPHLWSRALELGQRRDPLLEQLAQSLHSGLRIAAPWRQCRRLSQASRFGRRPGAHAGQGHRRHGGHLEPGRAHPLPH